MGIRYLSCTADSAILTCDSRAHASVIAATPNRPTARNGKNKSRVLRSGSLEDDLGAPGIQQFDYSDLEAATDGFSPQKLLGRGSHGCVYKAVLRGGRLVAVKKPSCPGRSTSNAYVLSAGSNNDSNFVSNGEVENEIEILSKIRSPRLVNLIGFSNTPVRDSSSSCDPSRLLVVEFMSNGTLFDVLHSSPRPPEWGRRLRLALQTAMAIETLHSSTPPVIHRDIKSANVLIDGNFNARLGDFGLALRCHANDSRLRLTPPAGTLGYLDPCYVTPENLSTKTDVFSFGILLLEIISGRKAIDVGHSPPSIIDWAIPLVKSGKVLALYDPRIAPPRDPLSRSQLALLAVRCVRSSKERRPSMKEIVEGLKVLCKTVPGHLWDNLSVNTCLTADEVGHVIGAKSPNSNSGVRRQKAADAGERSSTRKTLPESSRASSRMVRNSSRVYSDSGSSSRNLKDLMACNEANSDVQATQLERMSSFLHGISAERERSRGKSQHVGLDYDSDGLFRLLVKQR